MHPNSFLSCLARRLKTIVPQEGHYKFGFGNGRITNAMTSDVGSLSKVTSIPRCAVQWQLTHYWMGKTPCSDGIMVAMQLVWALTIRLKKSGASPLAPLHIAEEENSMTDIPSRLFGINLAWFCKNDTDLLNLFSKNFPLKIRPLWPSSSLPTQWVWSLFQCCGCSISKWASGFNSKRQENMLEKLVFLCQTFGSGALATGRHVPAAS